VTLKRKEMLMVVLKSFEMLLSTSFVKKTIEKERIQTDRRKAR